MEAEDGFGPSHMTQMKLVPWRDDWNLFKRLFKAAGRLNGIAEAIKVDQDVLRRTIRRILSRELPSTRMEFADVEVFWTWRWLWCVNGAHNRILEHRDKRYSLGAGVPKRIHRRVFVERCQVNPLAVWDGRTYYTASHKLEHGKRRAIFSCDSATYVCFEHLLRPVELAWRNKVGLFCMMVTRFGAGSERLLGLLDPTLTTAFERCQALCGEVVFLSNLA